MKTETINANQKEQILHVEEGYFSDVKRIEILPSKLTRTISAFANADGGDLYVGIEDDPRIWTGFESMEHANGHLQVFEERFPLGHGFDYTFFKADDEPGYVLRIEILKSHDIVRASDGVAYLRRGAQSLPQKEEGALNRLKQNKGIVSFETELVNVEKELIEESDVMETFVREVVPTTTSAPWLKKQLLTRDNRPTVAGIVLFADEPQAVLPKQCGIKIYRYQTKEEEGGRNVLAFQPITMEGNAYKLIEDSVNRAVKIIEDVKIMTPKGLKSSKYPKDALHELITNAVLHRDYSVPDDIHVRVFDNRVEIQSPGLLPAHITPENILEERFSRNGRIVRLINKFPNPPNKDVGEGLNTAFDAMKTARLVAPIITQKGLNVIVTLKHEPLASPEDLIMKYLEDHPSIANKDAREIANIGSENSMKHILRRLVDAKMLTVVKGATVFQTSYKKYEEE